MVTDIHLNNCAVDTWTLDVFIAGIAALREFTYDHSPSPEFGIPYDPHRIFEVLEKYAATSLVMLSLTAQQYFSPWRRRPDQYLGSLEMFSALKFVRGDDTLFGSAINCLGDMLPKSVEVSVLVTGSRNPRLPGLFLLEKDSFPNFKRLVIESPWRVDTALRDSLRACLGGSCEAHRWGRAGRHYTEFYTSGEGKFRIPDWPRTWPKCRADMQDGE